MGSEDVYIMHQRRQLIFKSESTEQRPTDEIVKFSFKEFLVLGDNIFSRSTPLFSLSHSDLTSVLLLRQGGWKVGKPPGISGQGAWNWARTVPSWV